MGSALVIWMVSAPRSARSRVNLSRLSTAGRSILTLAKAALSASLTSRESSSSAVGESRRMRASKGSFRAEFNCSLPRPSALASEGMRSSRKIL